jgi:hypothetical protein
MNSRKTPKRKRGTNPMVEGDVRLAQTVRPILTKETKKDGSTVTKRTWISMDTPTPNITTEATPMLTTDPNAEDTQGYEPHNMNQPVDTSPPPPGRPHTYRVSLYMS